MKMYRKLLEIFSVNILISVINFLSTILIVKSFGLLILGEFTVFNASVALLLLAYIVLPSNYSIFKLQDDNNYIKYFNFNYIFITIFLAPIVYFVGYIGVFKTTGLLLYSYVIIRALQNYFDILLQATNQLKIYFLFLFGASLIRFTVLLYLFIRNIQVNSLDVLIQIYLLPLVIMMLILVYMQRSIIFKQGLINIKDYFIYLKNNFVILRSYYFGTIIKRIKDNSLVLFFSILFSKEIIGLYTLFIKVGSVVLGQIRVVEAFMMNRSNLQNLVGMKEVSFIVGAIIQLILLGVGLIYLKINTGSFYLFSLLLYSFIVYPYFKTILSRSKLLSEYNNNVINQSYLLYIISISIAFFIAFLFKIENLNYLIIVTVLGEILISQTLSYKLKKVGKND